MFFKCMYVADACRYRSVQLTAWSEKMYMDDHRA